MSPLAVSPLAVKRAVSIVALLGLLSACGDTRSPMDASVGSDADSARDAGPPSDVGPRPDRGFEVCEAAEAFALPVAATLLLTVDTSGSMNCLATAASCATGEPTPAPDDSRYDVFRAVLRDALPALPSTTRVGAMHYPVTFSCAEDSLLSPIAELTDGGAAIDSQLASVTPEGITPTHDALAFALDRLRARPADEARFVVLATDGAATVCIGCDAACSFDDLDDDNLAMVERVRRAAEDDGVQTFVIGVPGSASYRDILSRMASASGTARAGCSDSGPTYCHYDLTDASLDFSSALADALASIGEAVRTCEYVIPDNPDGAFDSTQVNVRIEEGGASETIGRDASRQDGWDYSDDASRIELHGAACERARGLTDGRIDVLFGCPTELI